MTKINIQNKTNFHFKFKKIFYKITKKTLKILKIKGKTELSVIIVDNKEIQKISKKYRQKDKPTDILSFPTDFLELKKTINYNLLGDIYLSFEEISKQYKKFHHSEKREWSYLFNHGLLHLLGYDHKTKEEEKKMNSLAYKVMKKLKIYR